MDYVLLLNEVIKKHNYQSITYQNISVPNGWIVECKLSKNLNGSSYSGIGYDEDINLATKNAARLVYDQINRIDGFQSVGNPLVSNPTQRNTFKNHTKKAINMKDPLSSRPKQQQINTTKYRVKNELLDKNLQEYMNELLKRDIEHAIENEINKFILT